MSDAYGDGQQPARSSPAKTDQNSEVESKFSVRTSTNELPADLRGVIDSEVIPRLMLLHANLEDVPKTTLSVAKTPPIAQEHVLEFARLVLEQDLDVACAYIDTLRAQGFGTEQIMLELLAPAVRQFGVWWEEDVADFVDVTIASSRIQQLIHRYRSGSSSPVAKRVLLFPAPKEQHVLGLTLLAECFRARGWQAIDGYTHDDPEAMDLLAKEHWDFIGFSLSNIRLIDELTKAISDVRSKSHNPDIKVLVGGYVFSSSPERIDDVGADLTAASPADAIQRCEELLTSSGAAPS